MSTDRSDLASRAAWHAALGDPARLAIVDQLQLGDRSPGALQSALGLPSNLLAHHLRTLEKAGIVTRHRSEGDRRRTYLSLADDRATTAAATLTPSRVVFVCTGNSARSQLAAAVLRSAARIEVASGGTAPADRVAPGALAVAAEHDLALDDEPHRLQDVLRDGDLLIAICDQAYEELTDAVALHWSVPDPVRAGTAQAFAGAHEQIVRRVDRFVQHLPVAARAG